MDKQENNNFEDKKEQAKQKAQGFFKTVGQKSKAVATSPITWAAVTGFAAGVGTVVGRNYWSG